MSGFFTNRYKLPIHLFQVFLVIAVLALSGVRMLNQPKGAPRGRANTMALGMAAKSLIILLYEILSSHVRAFKKWASLKAYVILNALEIVFWGAVAFLMIQANIKFCSGLSCTLSWVVVVLAGIMSQVALYMTVVAWFDFRYFRANGVHRGSKYATVDRIEIRSINSDNGYKGRDRHHERHVSADGLMADRRIPHPGHHHRSASGGTRGHRSRSGSTENRNSHGRRYSGRDQQRSASGGHHRSSSGGQHRSTSGGQHRSQSGGQHRSASGGQQRSASRGHHNQGEFSNNVGYNPYGGYNAYNAYGGYPDNAGPPSYGQHQTYGQQSPHQGV